MTELRRPLPLDPRQHDRTGFDSGEPVLDEWLRRYAGQKRRRWTIFDRSAATWVIFDPKAAVVAYASIAMTGIDHSAAEYLGFHPFDATDQNCKDLYLLTAEIHKTLHLGT